MMIFMGLLFMTYAHLGWENFAVCSIFVFEITAIFCQSYSFLKIWVLIPRLLIRLI